MTKKGMYTAREVSLMLGEKDVQIEKMKVQILGLKKPRERWWRVGTMENGEGLYCDGPGNLAILKDYRYFVEPTQKEVKELRQREWGIMT